MCEKVVERINAVGPFTVVADMKEGTLNVKNVPIGGDSNTPAMTGIQEVTAVAINSAE